MQVESSCKPLLTIDEVEKVRRQKMDSFIAHVFQLTYAATVDKLIQAESLLRLCYSTPKSKPTFLPHDG